MEIKTFRAKTMPLALDLVRRELGPEAMVLHTRELNSGLVGRLLWGRAYEIAATPSPPPSQRGGRGGTADIESNVAARHGQSPSASSAPQTRTPFAMPGAPSSGAELDADPAPVGTRFIAPFATPPLQAEEGFARCGAPFGNDLGEKVDDQIAELQSLVEQLRARTAAAPRRDIPPVLFDVFTDMIEADVDEDVARQLLDRLQHARCAGALDAATARTRLAEMLQEELPVAGPIRAATGAGRVVALVGPTGVGKTTTIAKLAANYRLKENRRVGLITVDTYRIAAVEQLRTYAEIIDLPMEVVSTPREMREAVARMRDFDLVLMDTAGRSPRDEVRIRELRTMLAEAAPDEVHLVLSAAASARSLVAAAEKFAPVGVTAVLVTKLDEATVLGGLVSLARQAQLPFSYLTDGQNVPDDIAVAQSRPLAEMILNMAR